MRFWSPLTAHQLDPFCSLKHCFRFGDSCGWRVNPPSSDASSVSYGGFDCSLRRAVKLIRSGQVSSQAMIASGDAFQEVEVSWACVEISDYLDVRIFSFFVGCLSVSYLRLAYMTWKVRSVDGHYLNDAWHFLWKLEALGIASFRCLNNYDHTGWLLKTIVIGE